VIVFDLDGTLTDDRHRRHYLECGDFAAYNRAVLLDTPKHPVLRVMRALYNFGEVVQIWSGRDESARADTKQWFGAHAPWVTDYRTNIPILLRPTGDNAPSAALKERWLDEALTRSRPAVTMAFDDLRSAVLMWRRRGILCAQVEANDVEHDAR
jgi:FMN phosphatase YigB (HAD superfamily)